MPDVQEVFRTATQRVRPEPGFLDRQHQHQRRRSRNRRAGAYVLVAAIAVAGLVVVARIVQQRIEERPATQATEIPPAAEALSLNDLVGVWFEEGGSHLLSIQSDGSYALDDSGLLDTDPDDAGTVEIGEDGAIRFLSSGTSRACAPEDAWVWGVAEIAQAGLLEVRGADATCSVGIQGSSSWGLVGTRSPSGEPVPGPQEVAGRPVTEADLIGFWGNPLGPGLFRFSVDGTFAGYFPERLDSEPLLAGTWEVRGGRIRQVYTSTRIPGCAAGDVAILDAELVELDDGVALRTTVRRICGETLPPDVQVRVSPR